MLQKLNKSSRGFTLVEIMIVVAIIALLVAIAVPNFMRARKRSQATHILNDLRMLDSALDQYAVDTAKPAGFVPTFADIQNYLKTDTTLYATGADMFGDSYGPFTVDQVPVVPTGAFNALSDVADATFWPPYIATNSSSGGFDNDMSTLAALNSFMTSGGDPTSSQGQQLVANAKTAYQELNAQQLSGALSAQQQNTMMSAIAPMYPAGGSAANQNELGVIEKYGGN